LGVVDVGGGSIADRDVFAHALANLTEERREQSFVVKHSSTFVNEYGRRDGDGNLTDGGIDNPNHLLGAFPVLFPYGKGGLEVNRRRHVSYENHVRWALQYGDARFRKDISFVFQVFGVIQKRQMCRSAELQISKSCFRRNEGLINSITPKDLEKASAEEHRRAPYSNPGVRALRQHVTAVRSKVMGTDESRVGMRSKMWGMTMMKNPPSLWITINPSDVNDPIAQVMTGTEIDLDQFDKTGGPDANERSKTIVGDPFAAAHFFHFTIQAILETLFGITKRKPPSQILRKAGIFGRVAGYIGSVEAQGRGTLHLHLVLWLCGAPTAAQMKESLKHKEFRRKVAAYIEACIHADIKESDAKTVLAIPKEREISYSRPVDPRQPNYDTKAAETQIKLARAVQIHSCSDEACMVFKNGHRRCKRRAPFPLAKEAWIDETGEWGPKRFYAYLNNWNPTLLLSIRSNHDIKLITNGSETKAITWYITQYAVKKQVHSNNTSALLAKKIAFHRAQEKYTSDCRLLNKRLILRCANSLTSEQEIGAPEVISYLMKWGDRYISHNYIPIFLDAIVGALKRQFPDLRQKRYVHVQR
jgi:hypothetical protein